MSAHWLIGDCSAHTSHRRFPRSLVGNVLGCGLRSVSALAERLYPEMGLSRAWRFARGVALVAAVLVCVGAFFCLLPAELDGSTALRPADSHPLDRGADEGYLAVSQEWEADKDPANADVLTMLVLAVSFFGWLLTNTQRQGAMCSLGVVGHSLASAYDDLPFLGVLRL